MHSRCHPTSIQLLKKFFKKLLPTDPNFFQHVTVNTHIIFFALPFDGLPCRSMLFPFGTARNPYCTGLVAVPANQKPGLPSWCTYHLMVSHVKVCLPHLTQNVTRIVLVW